MKRIIFAVLLCLSLLNGIAQSQDSLGFSMYKDRLVLYSDLGFRAAPFSVQNNFLQSVEKIRFKHNIKLNAGFGIMYKWFAFRLAFSLPGTILSKSRYGRSKNFDLGLSFGLKKNWFFDFDTRSYHGYVIKNAYKWNDTLNKLNPNDLRPNTQVFSASSNAWYFFDRSFKVQAVMGKAGHYNTSKGTWYVKNTLNLFGVGNRLDPITPEELIDTALTRNSADGISALDFGMVPGYAYVKRINNWQVSAFGGLGGVIQAKFYGVKNLTRGFIGIAPRVDLRFIGGYSKPNYFLWFVTDFDIKSIRHQELVYNQTYYSLKLVAGVRLAKKDKKKIKSN
ncbi:MAG: DUF4421 family protein [Crocinitomicaceae bacterium]|nr:DUF4421 family protein [Crocinitomicaceae bacterium]